MTRFRGAKACSKWLQERSDDHNIQSDNRVFLLEHTSVLIPGAICEDHVILDVLVLFRKRPTVLLSGNFRNWKSAISDSIVHHQSLPQGVGHNLRKVDVDAASHVHNRRPIQASEPEESNALDPSSLPPRCKESASSATVALFLIFNDGFVQMCEDQGPPRVHPIRRVFAVPYCPPSVGATKLWWIPLSFC